MLGKNGDEATARTMEAQPFPQVFLHAVPRVRGCKGDPFQHRGTVSLGSASPSSLPPSRLRCWCRWAAIGQIASR